MPVRTSEFDLGLNLGLAGEADAGTNSDAPGVFLLLRDCGNVFENYEKFLLCGESNFIACVAMSTFTCFAQPYSHCDMTSLTMLLPTHHLGTQTSGALSARPLLPSVALSPVVSECQGDAQSENR